MTIAITIEKILPSALADRQINRNTAKALAEINNH